MAYIVEREMCCASQQNRFPDELIATGRGKLQVQQCPQCPVSDGRPEKDGLSECLAHSMTPRRRMRAGVFDAVVLLFKHVESASIRPPP